MADGSVQFVSENIYSTADPVDFYNHNFWDTYQKLQIRNDGTFIGGFASQ